MTELSASAAQRGMAPQRTPQRAAGASSGCGAKAAAASAMCHISILVDLLHHQALADAPLLAEKLRVAVRGCRL